MEKVERKFRVAELVVALTIARVNKKPQAKQRAVVFRIIASRDVARC